MEVSTGGEGGVKGSSQGEWCRCIPREEASEVRQKNKNLIWGMFTLLSRWWGLRSRWIDGCGLLSKWFWTERYKCVVTSMNRVRKSPGSTRWPGERAFAAGETRTRDRALRNFNTQGLGARARRRSCPREGRRGPPRAGSES